MMATTTALGTRPVYGRVLDDGAGPRLRGLLLGRVVPGALAGLGLAVFLGLPAVAYLGYHATAYDLGFFDNVVENTAAGHPFETSFLSYSFLGQHWEPVLALWAPLDRISPSALWLVAVQALALAATPIAAWRLARAWVGRGWAAPLAALACVMDPLVLRGAAFYYHSEALTPALALFALDGAARGRRWRFLLPALALALVKEDALLVVVGVGWLAYVADHRREGLALAAGALAAFAIVVGVVMPSIRGGDAGDLAGLYAYLGGTTPGAVVRGALTHPDRALRQLTGDHARRALLVAFAPLALLPLLAGRALLAAVPVLLVALLSSGDAQSQLLFHYGLEAFPLLLACALLGWRALASRPRPRRPRPRVDAGLAAAMAVGLMGGVALAAPRPSGGLGDLDRRGSVERVLGRIPAGAPVTASSGLVPHLSERRVVHEFPDRAFEEPFVVLDESGPRASWTLAGYAPAVAALPVHGYHVVSSEGGVTLWAR